MSTERGSKSHLSRRNKAVLMGVSGGLALGFGGNVVRENANRAISQAEATRNILEASLSHVVDASDKIAPHIVMGSANGRLYPKYIALSDPSKARRSLQDAAAALRIDEKSSARFRYKEGTLPAQLKSLAEKTSSVDRHSIEDTNQLLTQVSEVVSTIESDRMKYMGRRSRKVMQKFGGIASQVAGSLTAFGFMGYEIYRKWPLDLKRKPLDQSKEGSES